MCFEEVSRDNIKEALGTKHLNETSNDMLPLAKITPCQVSYDFPPDQQEPTMQSQMFEFPKAKTRKQHLTEYKKRLASNAKYERAMYNSLKEERESKLDMRKASLGGGLRPLANYQMLPLLPIESLNELQSSQSPLKPMVDMVQYLARHNQKDVIRTRQKVEKLITAEQYRQRHRLINDKGEIVGLEGSVEGKRQEISARLPNKILTKISPRNSFTKLQSHEEAALVSEGSLDIPENMPPKHQIPAELIELSPQIVLSALDQQEDSRPKQRKDIHLQKLTTL